MSELRPTNPLAGDEAVETGSNLPKLKEAADKPGGLRAVYGDENARLKLYRRNKIDDPNFLIGEWAYDTTSAKWKALGVVKFNRVTPSRYATVISGGGSLGPELYNPGGGNAASDPAGTEINGTAGVAAINSTLASIADPSPGSGGAFAIEVTAVAGGSSQGSTTLTGLTVGDVLRVSLDAKRGPAGGADQSFAVWTGLNVNGVPFPKVFIDSTTYSNYKFFTEVTAASATIRVFATIINDAGRVAIYDNVSVRVLALSTACQVTNTGLVAGDKVTHISPRRGGVQASGIGVVSIAGGTLTLDTAVRAVDDDYFVAEGECELGDPVAGGETWDPQLWGVAYFNTSGLHWEGGDTILQFMGLDTARQVNIRCQVEEIVDAGALLFDYCTVGYEHNGGADDAAFGIMRAGGANFNEILTRRVAGVDALNAPTLAGTIQTTAEWRASMQRNAQAGSARIAGRNIWTGSPSILNLLVTAGNLLVGNAGPVKLISGHPQVNKQLLPARLKATLREIKVS